MTYDIVLTRREAQPAAVVRGHAEQPAIADFLGRAYGEVMEALQQQGLQPAGAPFGCYLPTPDGGFDIEAGFPASGPVTASGDVVPLELPAGQCAQTMHVGAWSKLDGAYLALREWADQHGYRPSAPPWESYLDGPEVAEPRTEVFLPCSAATADGA